MKKKRDNNNVKLAIVCVVFIAALVLAGYNMFGRGPHKSGAYFLDLNTGKVFVGPANITPPIDTPSGPYQGEPAGVKLYIFACAPARSFDGKTLDQVRAAGAFPVWVEKYEAEAKKALDAGSNEPELIMEGLLTMAPPPDGKKWLKPSSREARALRDSVKQLCPSGKPVQCTP